jgi:hypothetical protein
VYATKKKLFHCYKDTHFCEKISFYTQNGKKAIHKTLFLLLKICLLMKLRLLLSHAPVLFTVRGMHCGVEPEPKPFWKDGGEAHKILFFYGLFNSREKARAFW